MTTKNLHDEHDDWFTRAARSVAQIAGQMLGEARGARDEGLIAEGMLDAAINFWLHVHHPCGRASCAPCAQINTPQKRVAELTRLVAETATDSPFNRAEHDVKAAGGPGTVQ